jgi:ABC-type Fe3+-siderophore transport system permease subunit
MPALAAQITASQNRRMVILISALVFALTMVVTYVATRHGAPASPQIGAIARTSSHFYYRG